MKTTVRILLFAAALAFGVLAYRHLFPSDEQRIRRTLSSLAEAACIPADAQPLADLAAVQKLAGYFTLNAEIRVDGPEYGQHTLTGRDEVRQAALAARSNLRNLKVEFLDVNVVVADGKQTATAELTAKVTQKDRRDFGVQELKFQFQKDEDQWRIGRVETVKTLRL